jgi:bilirubin oxidase
MAEFSRRTVLGAGLATGAGLFIPLDGVAHAVGSTRGPTLAASAIPLYVAPLLVPPVMPRARHGARRGLDVYVIAVRQFRQQVLPPGMPRTTVWGYGHPGHPRTFHYPSFTVEAKAGRPARVTWVNGLVDRQGRYLPHLLPVDPTIHWANPPGGVKGRDSTPTFRRTPGPYTGPVPIVTHLHGGHTAQESDGYTEAWYLPAARDIPRGFAEVGSRYDEFARMFADHHGIHWRPGTATSQYENRQPAATMWFHDHVLGMTRLNVYAGPAGFYLLRGGAHDLEPGVLPGPAPRAGDEPGTAYHEIPLAIQDRSFDADGSLFYPDSRSYFDGFTGPYIPGSDISPIWNPEFFGTTMLVNGRTWPDLAVRRRRYRFRILNGCNSRFMVLTLTATPLAARPVAPALPWWQIGSDGGFLPRPRQLDRLVLAPAERADVVVDFTHVPEGTELYLVNEGPDAPYAGGVPGVDFEPADPLTTGQVMRFSVGSRPRQDASTPPDELGPLPSPPKPRGVDRTRRLALVDVASSVVPGVTPREIELGVIDDQGRVQVLGWDDPITETPRLGSTEIWEFHNRTPDAHPMHIHEIQMEVVSRQATGGPRRGPEPSETGLKDTVIALPGEITRVRAHFDRPGLFVWHCHVVEHEDNEMMRPFRIVR